MSQMHDDMASLLGLPAIPPPVTAVTPAPTQTRPVHEADEPTDQAPLDADFDLARKNLREMAMQGSVALDNLIDLANSSEHPRAFEVVAQMIKTLADTNKDILTLHKQRQDLATTASKPSSPTGSGSSSVHVEKAVFVGSTAELQELLLKRQEARLSTVDEVSTSLH